MRTPFGFSPMSGMGMGIGMGMAGMIDHGVPHSSPTFLKQEMNPLMSPAAVSQSHEYPPQYSNHNASGLYSLAF